MFLLMMTAPLAKNSVKYILMPYTINLHKNFCSCFSDEQTQALKKF